MKAMLALILILSAGMAEAFELTWDADPQDNVHGYRLYRHKGPCSDVTKRWRLIVDYQPDVRRGSAPNGSGTQCYVLRSYRNENGVIKLSADSNIIQRPPVAPTNVQVQEVNP